MKFEWRLIYYIYVENNLRRHTHTSHFVAIDAFSTTDGFHCTVASFRSSSSSPSFGGASSNMRRMIRLSSSISNNHDATIRRLFSNNNSSARYLVVESDGDYESMTVSELRSRGLMVSGIKAQLVELLGTGTVNPRKVGNSRPWRRIQLQHHRRQGRRRQ